MQYKLTNLNNYDFNYRMVELINYINHFENLGQFQKAGYFKFGKLCVRVYTSQPVPQTDSRINEMVHDVHLLDNNLVKLNSLRSIERNYKRLLSDTQQLYKVVE